MRVKDFMNIGGKHVGDLVPEEKPQETNTSSETPTSEGGYECPVCLKPRPFPIVHESCKKDVKVEVIKEQSPTSNGEGGAGNVGKTTWGEIPENLNSTGGNGTQESWEERFHKEFFAMLGEYLTHPEINRLKAFIKEELKTQRLQIKSPKIVLAFELKKARKETLSQVKEVIEGLPDATMEWDNGDEHHKVKLEAKFTEDLLKALEKKDD